MGRGCVRAAGAGASLCVFNVPAFEDFVNDTAHGDYGGGGTAFWAAEDGRAADHHANPPALVLTPPAGTAIIFGGIVTHAGLPVTSGERSVFVARFSEGPSGLLPGPLGFWNLLNSWRGPARL